jgi:hypothetical protein
VARQRPRWNSGSMISRRPARPRQHALISSSDSASSAKAAVVLPLKGRFCEQDQLFAGVGAAVRQVIIAAVPVRNLHCAPILGPFISDNPVNAGCGMRAHRLQS